MQFRPTENQLQRLFSFYPWFLQRRAHYHWTFYSLSPLNYSYLAETFRYLLKNTSLHRFTLCSAFWVFYIVIPRMSRILWPYFQMDLSPGKASVCVAAHWVSAASSIFDGTSLRSSTLVFVNFRATTRGLRFVHCWAKWLVTCRHPVDYRTAPPARDNRRSRKSISETALGWIFAAVCKLSCRTARW